MAILLCLGYVADAQKSYGPRTDSLLNLAKSSVDEVADSLYMEAGRSLAYIKPVEAINLLRIGLDLSIKTGNSKVMCMAYSFIGIAYSRIGSFDNAIEYYNYQMDVAKEYGIVDEVAWANNNIGLVLLMLKNYEMSNNYLQESKDLTEVLDDDHIRQYVYANIGRLKLDIGDFDSSLYYFGKVLELRLKPPVDSIDLSASYRDLGNIYFSKKSYQEAKYYFALSTQLVDTMISDMSAASNVLLSRIYIEENNPDSALYCIQKAISVAKRFNDRLVLSEAYAVLGNFHLSHRNFEQANAAFTQQILYQDSIKSSNVSFKIYNLQYQKEILDQQQEIRLAKERNKAYVLLSVGILVIVVGGIFFAWRLKRKRQVIADINRSLIDYNFQIGKSIDYARKIQQAVFPNFDGMGTNITEKFILLKPKGHISGTFYWTHKVGSVEMLAVSDSGVTGVPGAFMCMLGSSILHEIAGCDNDPAIILELMRIKVKQVLHRLKVSSENAVGVDVSLLVTDLSTNKIYYSGVKQPLLVVRNGELICIQENNDSNNFYDHEFVTSELLLQENDFVYMMTDGFYLQRNEAGEELSRDRLYNYLREIYVLPVDDQRFMLKKFLKQWRGDVDQDHDILIAGGIFNQNYKKQ